ncbi:MAG: hypothetical protein ACR2G5_17310 [Pyrinomonadaceae bacterium]
MLCRSFYLAVCVILTATFSSAVSAQENASPVSKSFDFRSGALGWQAGFARYPPATDIDDFYKLRAEMRSLPNELGVSGTGFYFQGNNLSDALVMFMKRRLDAADGVVAGQAYQVNFTLVFASIAQSACFGIGGSPGDSVFLEAGASPAEPVALLDTRRPFNHLQMNVDIGGGDGPNKDGIAASIAGTIANGVPCDSAPKEFISIRRNHQHTTLVNANSKGEVWLLVGTGSGYEGLTALYYQRIDVTLTPVSPPPPPKLFADGATERAAALDSVTLMREPFPVVSAQNFSSDQRTRLTLFAYNLELKAGEGLSAITAQGEDAQRRIYPLAIEAINELPNFSWITQVTVKLPDELQNAGDLWVSISLRGVASNKTLIRIK